MTFVVCDVDRWGFVAAGVRQFLILQYLELPIQIHDPTEELTMHMHVAISQLYTFHYRTHGDSRMSEIYILQLHVYMEIGQRPIPPCLSFKLFYNLRSFAWLDLPLDRKSVV